MLTPQKRKKLRRILRTMTEAQLEDVKCALVKLIDDYINDARKKRSSIAHDKWLRERDEKGKRPPNSWLM
jgi:hypothetical protein